VIDDVIMTSHLSG